MIDGRAYKLGDIIRYKNGLTVEVVNTDAEGRLVLADGLQAAGEFGAKQIIDAATLTGAAQMAVGNEYNALFSVDEVAATKALANADKENELLWRLPLAPWHSENCPSAFADTANNRPQKAVVPVVQATPQAFTALCAEQRQRLVALRFSWRLPKSATSMWATGATAAGVRTIAATVQGD